MFMIPDTTETFTFSDILINARIHRKHFQADFGRNLEIKQAQTEICASVAVKHTKNLSEKYKRIEKQGIT